MGAQLAMSSGRYGIITGRINRAEAEPLVTVSFPYASPEGYKLEVDGEMKDANTKGVVNEDGKLKTRSLSETTYRGKGSYYRNDPGV